MNTAISRLPRIALVGCGAVAESLHLPALARNAAVCRNAVLVDPNRERAESLARSFGAGSVETRYEDVLDRVDGAIVAVPHHLHHAISKAFLDRGLSVMCEKPLSVTARDAQELVRSSREHGGTLMVNQILRMFPSSQKVHELVSSGSLGEVRSIAYSFGEPFDWPAASGAYFGKAAGGKGVLLDKGAHVVDLVCWWLGGEPELVDYRDDAAGGTEAVADIRIARGPATAHVRLSWLSKLPNSYRVVCEGGVVEGDAYDWSAIKVTRTGESTRVVRCAKRGLDFQTFSQRLVENFIEVLAGEAEPLVTGEAVLASIELIDASYESRRPFDNCWDDVWRRCVEEVTL